MHLYIFDYSSVFYMPKGTFKYYKSFCIPYRKVYHSFILFRLVLLGMWVTGAGRQTILTLIHWGNVESLIPLHMHVFRRSNPHPSCCCETGGLTTLACSMHPQHSTCLLKYLIFSRYPAVLVLTRTAPLFASSPGLRPIGGCGFILL